ncbi:MAG: membrane dipeptidase [Clostridia bacterium]|nr:membrane dipeptidase [Clostridia bacterium]
MNYVDLHCDTLTESAKSGHDLRCAALQTNLEKLKKSGCAAQCFAIFTQGENAARFFEESLNWYGNMLELNADLAVPVLNSSCLDGDKLGCILTVENLGFIGEDLSRLTELKASGVKMASLVWNFENSLAAPNLIFKDGLPQFERRNDMGLTKLGREAVERLRELKIIIDISHLSDGGAEEILSTSKEPVVASHSNAAEVCNVSRNLTDAQIKKVADSGGVIGVNFCKDFLGPGDTFDCVLRHVKHIINVGGEDVVALGSDFDGIPAPPGLEDCARMPNLLEYLSKEIPFGALEKLCFKNFLRVLKHFD